MPFSNILPTTQLVLPDGGAQVGGSGTTVIGGPLPPELVTAGYNGSAIIWYSSGSNASNYQYAFLAHSDNTFANGDLISGYTDNAGVVHAISDNSGVTFFIKQKLAIGLFTGGPTIGTLQYDAIGNELKVTWAPSAIAALTIGVAHLRSNNTDAYLTYNSAVIDVWQTAAIAGTNWSGNVDYRISFDRICEVRIQITFTVAPATGLLTFLAVIPAAVRPTASPNNYPIAGSYTASGSSGGVSQIVPATGDLKILNGAAQLVYQTSFTYQIAKPTF